MGWAEENDPAPEPLRIHKKRRIDSEGVQGSSFDETSVPKPSDDELEKPWGGRRHFMMSHGLKCKYRSEAEVKVKAYEVERSDEEGFES